MRHGLGLFLGAVIGLAALSACDDQDTGKHGDGNQKSVASAGTAGPVRLGEGWRSTAQNTISSWGSADTADGLEDLRVGLEAGMLPPRSAVNIAALVNRFANDLPRPESGAPGFRTTLALIPSPWNDDTILLMVGISEAESATAGRFFATPDRPAVTVEFDKKTILAFRPLGNASALPAGPGASANAIMLYELEPIHEFQPQRGRAQYGAVRLRYRASGASPLDFDLPILSSDFVPRADDAPAVARFAAAIAGFGALLAGDPGMRDFSCGDAIELARNAALPDPDGTHQALIGLMQRAQPLIDQPPSELPAAETAR